MPCHQGTRQQSILNLPTPRGVTDHTFHFAGHRTQCAIPSILPRSGEKLLAHTISPCCSACAILSVTRAQTSKEENEAAPTRRAAPAPAPAGTLLVAASRVGTPVRHHGHDRSPGAKLYGSPGPDLAWDESMLPGRTTAQTGVSLVLNSLFCPVGNISILLLICLVLAFVLRKPLTALALSPSPASAGCPGNSKAHRRPAGRPPGSPMR